MTIRELFCKRIYAELLNFQIDLLKQDKEVIYFSAYKIEVYSNLYNILYEQSKYESEATLMQLMYRKGSILEYIYNGWLKVEDSFVDELKTYTYTTLFGTQEMLHAS